MAFVFPTDDALHFALTGGLIPPEVSLAPARTGRDCTGRPWIAPVSGVPDSLATTLRCIGVESVEDPAYTRVTTLAERFTRLNVELVVAG